MGSNRSLALVVLGLLGPVAAAQSPIYSVQGELHLGGFGRAVRPIGDADLDGFPDFAVGAPGGVLIPAQRPIVRVVSGATGSTHFELSSPTDKHLFGASIAGPGDLDGDGHPDLLVAMRPSLVVGRGFAVAVSGADGTRIFGLASGAGADEFGWAVSGIGDVDLDGVPDLLVGSPTADQPSSNVGAVHLFSGATGTLLMKIVGPATGTRFGAAVAGLSDQDGDGVPEIAVGAPHDPGHTQAGTVRAFSGATGAPWFVSAATDPNHSFGFSIDRATDQDGDGADDVVAGTDPFLGTDGYVRVLSGSSGAVIHHMVGASGLGGFGRAVSDAGDVDADGFGDVLVGAAGDLGGLGRVEARSGRTGGVLATFTGTQPNQQLGGAVGGPIDVNQDGRLDALLGSPAASVHGSVVGKVVVFTVIP